MPHVTLVLFPLEPNDWLQMSLDPAVPMLLPAVLLLAA
jgi:hypothetical protein